MFRIDLAPLSFTGNKMILVNQNSGEDEIINAILSVSTFDYSKIPPDIIGIISRNWLHFTLKALNIFSTTCPTMSAKSLIAFIYLGRMTAILESKQRGQKLSNSPISIFSRKLFINLEKHSTMNLLFEYIQIPDLSNEIRVVNYLFNLFNMKHFNFYDVILWSLQLTIIHENMTNSFPSFDELKRIPNYIHFSGDKSNLPQNVLGFAIIRYLYNKIFDVHVNFPFKVQANNFDFSFKLKIDDSLCWNKSFPPYINMSSYLYANSFPNLNFLLLAEKIPKIPIGIFTIILLNFQFNFSDITQNDVDKVIDTIKSFDSPYQSILLLLIYSAENELFKKSLEMIISDDSLSENWANAASLLLDSKNKAIDRYISKANNGNIKAAKKLCYFPECYEKIKEISTFPLNCVKIFFDENNIQQNLEIKANPTLENAILLYKMFKNNLLISNESYLPLLKECHSILIKTVHDNYSLSDSEWIMSGCTTFPGSFYLPKYPADLIFDQKGNEAYISFLNAFFASKCLKDQKLPEIPEVADFFTCSFFNVHFLNDFPSFSLKLIQKSRSAHVEAAFNADQKIFVLRVCKSVKQSNNAFSPIVEVLTKHDAYDMFVKIITDNISFLQYFSVFSNEYKCNFILRYLTENNIQEKSPDDLLQIMKQILVIDDNTTDSIVYKVVATILEKNPEFALKIINTIPLKKTFVETILSNIHNIPSPISIEYLAFIKEISGMLDKVQCQSSFTPMKAFNNDWNEDYEISYGDSKKKKKSKKSIWDYPDDIGECTQLQTGKDYKVQPWFHCITCELVGNTGCCLPCALRCHRHHDITYAKTSGFYCDCYEKIEICKFLQDKYKSENNDFDMNENEQSDDDESRNELILPPGANLPGFISSLNNDQISGNRIIVLGENEDIPAEFQNGNYTIIRNSQQQPRRQALQIGSNSTSAEIKRQALQQYLQQNPPKPIQQQNLQAIPANPGRPSNYATYVNNLKNSIANGSTRTSNSNTGSNNNDNQYRSSPRNQVSSFHMEDDYDYESVSEYQMDDDFDQLDNDSIYYMYGNQRPTNTFGSNKYPYKIPKKTRYQPQTSLNSSIQSIFYRRQPNYSLSNNPLFSFADNSPKPINFSFKPLNQSSKSNTTETSNTSTKNTPSKFSTSAKPAPTKTATALKRSPGIPDQESTSDSNTKLGFSFRKPTAYGSKPDGESGPTTTTTATTTAALSAPPSTFGSSNQPTSTASTSFGYRSNESSNQPTSTASASFGYRSNESSNQPTSTASTSFGYRSNESSNQQTSTASASFGYRSNESTGTAPFGSFKQSTSYEPNYEPNYEPRSDQEQSQQSFGSGQTTQGFGSSNKFGSGQSTQGTKLVSTSKTGGFGSSQPSQGTGFASSSSKTGGFGSGQSSQGTGFGSSSKTAGFGSGQPSQGTKLVSAPKTGGFGSGVSKFGQQSSAYVSKQDGNSVSKSNDSWSPSYGNKPYGAPYSSKNKYLNSISNAPREPLQVRMQQDPINVLTAIMIISKMLNVKVTPPPPLQNRLTNYKDVKSIKFNGFPTCEADQFAHFENSGIRCIESTSFFLSMGSPIAPPQINICAAIGTNYDKIIVCEGQNARIYDMKTNKLLSSTEVKIAPLRITVSDLDGTIFAISSMYQVYVYSLNEENGQIEMNHKIELMLEELGRSLSVVSVDWVPLEPLHLAITCTTFVKIYDIPADCISPIACFNAKDRITSSFLTVYDEEPYVFIASSNGRIYYDKCNIDSNDGPCIFINSFPFNISNYSNPKSLTISYCQDSDLLFISSIGSTLLITRLSEMMSQQNKAQFSSKPPRPSTSGWGAAPSAPPPPSSSSFAMCILNISGHHDGFEFIGIHPDVPSIFILRDKISGDVIMVEFSSKGVSNFSIKSPSRPIQLINSSVSILGVFLSCGSIWSIGSDGYLYKLVSGKHQNSAVIKLKSPPEQPKPVSDENEENEDGNNKKGKKQSKRGLNNKKKQLNNSSILANEQNQSLISNPPNSLASIPSASASSTGSLSIQSNQNQSSNFNLNSNSQSGEFTETNPTLNEDFSNISNSNLSFSINSSENLTGQIESIVNDIDDDDEDEDDDETEEDDDDIIVENNNSIDYHSLLSSQGFIHHSNMPYSSRSFSKIRENRELRRSKLKSGEVDGFDFEVPATFWIESRIETSMISINDQNGNDCIQLLVHRRQSFHDHFTILTVTSLDSKNMIVGFKLCFDYEKRSIRSRPESVRIFNRRYVATQSFSRDFCLPLKKSEVGINKSYQIEIVSHSNELELDGIDVFVIDANAAENQNKKDWLNDSSFITDFIDVSEIKCENDVDYVIQSISAANFAPLQSYSKKDNDNDDIINKEDAELKKLFIWMYTNPKISLVSRRILIKALGNDVKRFEKLCTDAIIEICGEINGPDEKLKKLMWRDYAFLPQIHKNRIGNAIWKFYDDNCGALAFSSAFLYE